MTIMIIGRCARSIPYYHDAMKVVRHDLERIGEYAGEMRGDGIPAFLNDAAVVVQFHKRILFRRGTASTRYHPPEQMPTAVRVHGYEVRAALGVVVAAKSGEFVADQHPVASMHRIDHFIVSSRHRFDQ